MVTLFCRQVNPILSDAVNTLASNEFFQKEVIYQKRKQEDISHCPFPATGLLSASEYLGTTLCPLSFKWFYLFIHFSRQALDTTSTNGTE